MAEQTTDLKEKKKTKIGSVLKFLIPHLINDERVEIKIGHLPDNETLVVDIKVPGNKVGVLLGKANENGQNPMKMAMLKICKQIGFYEGFTEVVIKIGEQ